MRFMKVVQVAVVFGVGAFAVAEAATAQVIAEAPAVDVIDPLYAYGPVVSGPPALKRHRQQWSQRRYFAPDQLLPEAAYRDPRYGWIRPYAGGGYRQAPGYAARYRNRVASPFWYGRPWFSNFGYRQRYAGRIVTPRWRTGSQSALGTGYRVQW